MTEESAVACAHLHVVAVEGTSRSNSNGSFLSEAAKTPGPGAELDKTDSKVGLNDKTFEPSEPTPQNLAEPEQNRMNDAGFNVSPSDVKDVVRVSSGGGFSFTSKDSSGTGGYSGANGQWNGGGSGMAPTGSPSGSPPSDKEGSGVGDRVPTHIRVPIA